MLRVQWSSVRKHSPVLLWGMSLEAEPFPLDVVVVCSWREREETLSKKENMFFSGFPNIQEHYRYTRIASSCIRYTRLTLSSPSSWKSGMGGELSGMDKTHGLQTRR